MSLYRFEGSQETFGKKEKGRGERKQFQFLIPDSSFHIPGRKRPRRTLKTAQEDIQKSL